MNTTFLRNALFVAALVCTTAAASFAQYEDAEGCKDHPLFNRLQKYHINECRKTYDAVEFTVGPEKTQTVEGTVTRILYTFSGEYGDGTPSRLQIIRNYENAITQAGGKKVYSNISSDGGWTGATFNFTKDGKEYWVAVHDLINDPTDQFSFTVLEKEDMKQEISANDILNKINTGGSISLYINFDTGKATIKNDSQGIIDELHKMLTANPSLKIMIEGHTDNAGNKASNQTLSEQRAESVKKALVAKGIAADRIKTAGFGQDKPVADNSTEDGKAKNRRVEIKKL